MTKFELKIISPVETLYNGECESLTVPTSDGLYGIMANHSPAVISVSEGNIKIKNGETENRVSVSAALLCCKNNKVTIAIQ